MRDMFDDLFANTNTSILNIYAPCYYEEIESGKKWKIRQSGKKSPLTSDMDCEDSIGIHDFFNKPLVIEHLHV